MNTNNIQARQFSKAQVEQLCRDPNNIVMDYKTPKPLPQHKIVPIIDVRNRVNEIRKNYIMMCNMVPTKPIDFKTNELIRQKIRHTPKWSSFDKTHPTIFDMITNPKTKDSDIQNLFQLMDLHQKTKKSKPKKSKKQAIEFIQKTYGNHSI